MFYGWLTLAHCDDLIHVESTLIYIFSDFDPKDLIRVWREDSLLNLNEELEGNADFEDDDINNMDMNPKPILPDIVVSKPLISNSTIKAVMESSRGERLSSKLKNQHAERMRLTLNSRNSKFTGVFTKVASQPLSRVTNVSSRASILPENNLVVVPSSTASSEQTPVTATKTNRGVQIIRNIFDKNSRFHEVQTKRNKKHLTFSSVSNV